MLSAVYCTNAKNKNLTFSWYHKIYFHLKLTDDQLNQTIKTLIHHHNYVATKSDELQTVVLAQ